MKDPDRYVAITAREVVWPLLDTRSCAKLLGVSPDKVEQLRVRAGLPAIDLGFQHPGRRPKHMWRFDPVMVREWWIRRGQMVEADDDVLADVRANS